MRAFLGLFHYMLMHRLLHAYYEYNVYLFVCVRSCVRVCVCVCVCMYLYVCVKEREEEWVSLAANVRKKATRSPCAAVVNHKAEHWGWTWQRHRIYSSC